MPAPRPEPGADPARATDEPDAGALEVAEELAALGEAVPPPSSTRVERAARDSAVESPLLVPDLPPPTPAAPPPDAEPLLDTPLPVRTRPLLR